MYVITSRVVNTINSLPESDRRDISSALGAEMMFGEQPETRLTPLQCMLYAMIKFWVKQDTARTAVCGG